MSTKVLKYIGNSDYASLKNDSDTTTLTVSIPGTNIGAGVTQIYDNTLTIGSRGAPMEYDLECSITSKRFKTMEMVVVENASAANQYSVVCRVIRSSATQIKLKVIIFNYSGSTLTKNARTVTLRVRTFIPPF